MHSVKLRIDQVNSINIDIETKLEKILKSNTKKFRRQVVDRVHCFITYDIANPNGHSPYKMLKSIDDFILLLDLHPEWKTASSREMQRNEVEGGNAFYWNYRKFIEKLTDDGDRRDRLIRKIFRTRYKFRNYDSIEQWKDERKRTFPDYSPSQLDKSHIPGGTIFMKKLRGWLKDKYQDDSDKRKAMIKYVFDQEYTDRSSYTTILHWRNEYLNNPSLVGNSIRHLERGETKEGRAFVNNLRKWLMTQYPDNYQKRRDSRQKICQEPPVNKLGA